MINRLTATLAIALMGLISLTACGEEAKNVTEGAKDAMSSTAEKATEEAKDAMSSTAEGAKKATEGAKDAMSSTAEGAKNAMTDATQKVSDAAGSLVAMKDGVVGLKEGVSATLTAAKAGDFKTAQTEATKLQDAWGKISEGVEKQSGETYTKVEDGLKTVQEGLKAEKPDQAKVVADIQSLATAVSSIAIK